MNTAEFGAEAKSSAISYYFIINGGGGGFRLSRRNNPNIKQGEDKSLNSD